MEIITVLMCHPVVWNYKCMPIAIAMLLKFVWFECKSSASLSAFAVTATAHIITSDLPNKFYHNGRRIKERKGLQHPGSLGTFKAFGLKGLMKSGPFCMLLHALFIRSPAPCLVGCWWSHFDARRHGGHLWRGKWCIKMLKYHIISNKRFT